MLLTGIVNFINKQIKATQDQQLISVLQTVRRMLEESDDGRNIAQLQRAILYLHKIPIKSMGFFSSALGDILKEEERSTFDVDKASQEHKKNLPLVPESALSDEARRVLGSLTMALMRHYKPLAWSYAYPLGQDGQVMNDPIGEWQAQCMVVSESRDKAYRDFKRDITLSGEKSTSDAEVTKKIETLVAGAISYPEGDKEKLIQWLQHNGSQENNRFLDLLIASGHFSSLEQGGATLYKVKNIKQNWLVEHGKICFDYDIIINSISFEKNYERTFLYAVSDGKISITDDPEKVKKEITVREGQLPPYLMRVTAKMELAVDESGKIKPSIVALNVLNFSEKLLSPERLDQQVPRPSGRI